MSRKIWFAVTAVIFVYTAVLTVRNLITVIKVEHRISRLKEQEELFRQRIVC